MKNLLLAAALLFGTSPADARRSVEVRNPRGEDLRTDAEGRGIAPDGSFINLPAGGIHSANSSTIPLAALETSTGVFFDVSQYSGATISVITDADGTLMIDSSIDGIDIINTEEFSVSSGTTFFVGATPLGPFIRIRYTNGPDAQTVFFLTTMPKMTAINTRFQPLDAPLNDSSVAQVVRAILAGRDVTDGVYKAVGLEGDRLRVVSPPPTTPTGSTNVKRIITGTQSGMPTDDIFTIPLGSTVTLQRISGGSESGQGGGKVELFHDPTGTGSPLTLIETVYSNGSSVSFTLRDEFVGDGSAAIRMRRTNLGGGNLDMFSRWEGYTTP